MQDFRGISGRIWDSFPEDFIPTLPSNLFCPISLSGIRQQWQKSLSPPGGSQQESSFFLTTKLLSTLGPCQCAELLYNLSVQWWHLVSLNSCEVDPSNLPVRCQFIALLREIHKVCHQRYTRLRVLKFPQLLKDTAGDPQLLANLPPQAPCVALSLLHHPSSRRTSAGGRR